MTLIYGVNLSDRVYLAADTRITHRRTGRYKDNLQKIVLLSDTLAVATAGDAALARFLLDRLIPSEAGREDVRTFRARAIKTLRDWTSDYALAGSTHTRCCLLFGGRTRVGRKRIVGAELVRRVAEFQKYSRNSLTGASVKVKPVLWRAMQRTMGHSSPELELDCSDSHLFAALIDSGPDGGVSIEDAEWGEVLAYGEGGLRKESVSREAFGRLEFQGGHRDADYILLCGVIKRTAEKHQLGTVGGGVVVAVIHDSFGTGLILGVDVYGAGPADKYLTGEIRVRQDGQKVAMTVTGDEIELEPLPKIDGDSIRSVYLVEPSGTKTKLVPISEYEGFDELCLSGEMLI